MIIINNENKSLEAVIALDGAELLSVRREAFEYMWQANKKYWGRTAPVLFPIVGRLQDDKYTVDNNEYQLTQHGFARDMRFTVKEQSESSVSLELQANEETKKKYPYDFSLIIKYTFKDDDLHVEYIVKNQSAETMNYSIGAHPAFNLDPECEYTFSVNDVNERYLLEGPYVSQIVKSEQKEYVIEPETFNNDAVILASDNPKKIVSIYENGSEYIKMTYNDFKLLGVWSPYHDHVPFVCLEPWNGLADLVDKTTNELAKKEFINQIPANEKQTQKYTITFK